MDTEILRVQATDADSNAANSMVAYFLDNSPDAAFFTIDNMTGDIYNAVILVSPGGEPLLGGGCGCIVGPSTTPTLLL